MPYGPAINIGLTVLEKCADFMPSYEEETVVSVWGNAYSQKGNLFNQAVAIAFGQSARFNFLTQYTAPFVLSAEFDMMAKSVTVTLRYIYNGILSKLSSSAGFAFVDRFFSDPGEDLICGKPKGVWFNFIDTSVYKDGKRIATGYPSEVDSGAFLSNPIPPFDNGTRGTFLEKLVFASLAQPCQLNNSWSSMEPKVTPVTVPLTPRETGASGTLSSSLVAAPGSDATLSTLSAVLYVDNTTENSGGVESVSALTNNLYEDNLG